MEQRAGKIKKRNRLSFVCQECRRRKTKCDKLRPRCGRCVDAGFSCTYVSRNGYTGRIVHLERNQRVGKTRTVVSDSDTEVAGSDRSMAGANGLGMDSCSCGTKRRTKEGLTSVSRDDVVVDLGDTEDTIVSHENMKYLHKPFSMLAMMQRDHYLRAFAGSVSGYTLSATESLCSNEIFNDPNYSYKKSGASNLSKYGRKDTKELPIQAFLEDLLKNKGQANKGRVRRDFEQLLLFPSVWNLEDEFESVSAYPMELHNLLSEIEDILPEINAFKHILNHFYEVVYPLYPLLDVPSFEKVIHEVLIPPADHTGKYKVNLGTKHIRNKLENLTILLLILKISYAQLRVQFNSHNPQQYEELDLLGRNQVKEEAVTLVQKCLSILSATKFTNENYLCCLLYMWIEGSLSPDNARNARLNLLPHEILMLGTISHLAAILGLHKDPSSYRMLVETLNFDKSLLNYRRKLWLGVVSIRMNELLPNGSGLGFTYELMNSFSNSKQNKESYMSSVIRDGEPDTAFDIPLHELIYKEYQLQFAWTRLNSSCNALNKSTPLSEIEKLILSAEDALFQLFPLTDIMSSHKASKEFKGVMSCTEDKVQIDYVGVRSVKAFINNLLGRLIVLNMTAALTSYFENLCRDDPSKYLVFYQKYLVQFFRRSLELVKVIMKLLSEELDDSMYSKFKYALTRIKMISLVRTMMSVCSIIIRLTFSENELRKFTESESLLYGVGNSSNSSYRLQMVVDIKETLTHSLRTLSHYASKISKDYFVFHKVICVFKYVFHLIDIGKLFEATNRFWDHKISGKPIPETVANRILLKWGINLEEAQAVKDDLVNINVLGAIDSGILENFSAVLQNLDLTKSTESSPEPEGPQNVSKEPEIFSDLPLENLENLPLFNSDLLDYFNLFDDTLPGQNSPSFF